VTSDLR